MLEQKTAYEVDKKLCRCNGNNMMITFGLLARNGTGRNRDFPRVGLMDYATMAREIEQGAAPHRLMQTPSDLPHLAARIAPRIPKAGAP
jgi:hypothetical protein